MRKFIDFLRALSEDQRIPLQNRLMLTGLLAYLLIPFDIIPDYIPILGWLDDAFVMILIMEYVFNSADTEIILEHYPWSKSHFDRWKTYAERLSWIIPRRLKKIMFKEAHRLAIASNKNE